MLLRLREKTAQLNLKSRESYRLSLSIGSARFDGEGRTRLDDLLSKADEEMYAEKRAKRQPRGTEE